ncbi:MAG: MFS transporter [Nocardioidaceae bacterium]
MPPTTTLLSRARDERVAPTFSTIAAVSIAALAVVGQLYATLPLISSLAGEFGTSMGAATWASTSFGFAYAVGMLVAGPLSDAVGRRRVAVGGLLASALASLLVSVSPSFLVLLLTRLAQGAAAAFFAPVALAYLTERIAPRQRSIALTTVISAFLAAAIVAPLTASALAALGGWRTWFYVSAAGLVVLAAVVWQVLLPDIGTRAGRRSSHLVTGQLRSLPKLLGQPVLAGLYLAALSVMFTFVGITTLVQLAGPGTADHSAVMQVVRAATLPACVIVPLVTPLLGKVPAPRRLVPATALGVVGAILTGVATGPVSVAIALGVLTIAVAATAPALVETIGQTSPPGQRGAATALYGFALFVGASLGAPAATAVADHTYLIGATIFAGVAALGGVSALLSSEASKG